MATVLSGAFGSRTAKKPSLLKLVTELWQRYRDRRELAGMSPDLLRDIGLTRADVDREVLRPIWEPIDADALEQARHLSSRRTPFPYY